MTEWTFLAAVAPWMVGFVLLLVWLWWLFEEHTWPGSRKRDNQRR